MEAFAPAPPEGRRVSCKNLTQMSLRTLSLLVLAVLLGTAVSVRWYLEADQRPASSRELTAPPAARQHVALPIRAEPARPSARVATSRPALGAARSNPSAQEDQDAYQAEPAGNPAPPPPRDPSPAGAFLPPQDPL